MTSSGMAAGRRATRQPWFAPLARAGIVAKGVIYAIIGGLALALALGAGGKATDSTGALQSLADRSFGTLALVALAAGLAGYALWSLAQGLLDTDREGDSPGSLVTRAGRIGSGIAHGFLAVLAVRLVTGSGGGSASQGQEPRAAAGVLGWPAGQEIVAVVGLVVIGVGAYQVWKGLSRDFMEYLSVSGDSRRMVERLGMVGIVARGLVFVLAGVFVTKAAIEFDPSEAEGLDGTLARLADQPFGAWLLGAAALGLLAFAAYCACEARYRRISPSPRAE